MRALRVDDAVAENEDLLKMRRFLQAELRQANETIVPAKKTARGVRGRGVLVQNRNQLD